MFITACLFLIVFTLSVVFSLDTIYLSPLLGVALSIGCPRFQSTYLLPCWYFYYTTRITFYVFFLHPCGVVVIVYFGHRVSLFTLDTVCLFYFQFVVIGVIVSIDSSRQVFRYLCQC